MLEFPLRFLQTSARLKCFPGFRMPTSNTRARVKACGRRKCPMTLCFSQDQAAAVYAATKGSREPVYVSPFVGRLDDHGENGIDLIKNIKEMYKNGDGHVHVLAASIRHLEHLLASFAIRAELTTVPAKLLADWATKDFPMPAKDFSYKAV